ncbi:MAG: protein translocase subunit SecD [bacterium]|nr:protein translocase subunit SecD [bacterium]
MSSQKWRVALTALLVVAAFWAFWNTFELWTMSDSEKQTMQEKDPGKLLTMQQKAIRLGLDLQGGIHVVLRVKLEDLDAASKEGAVDRAIQVVRNRIDALGVAEPVIQKEGDDRIIVDLPGYTDAARAEELIGQTAVLEFKLLESIENANLLLSKIDTVISAIEKENSSPTAATTTPTTPTGDNQVMADLMGDTTKKDTSASAYEFDETTDYSTDPLTSRLELTLVSSRTSTAWPGYTVNKKDQILIDRWLKDPRVKALVPPDVEFAWSTRSMIREAREVYELFLLKRKVQFPGNKIEGISLGRENMGGLAVNFKLSGDAAARFAQLTGANIDKPLAIVMDDRVESAAFINSKIRNSGQITMGTGASFDDARNLEIVLKAGSLPAPVEIIAKNVVGATLGSDTISKGFWAALVGLLLVLAYIAFYYKVSGLIADIGLIFNLFFLLAVMAALGATLTMPGIAGIILTIGMSVDSNILIFERIREELLAGKTVRAAIDAGYDRAWVAILDSHVTTLITAGALFILGSGSIKGFAVSLFWGVLISLFTAYVITKLIFDFRKQYKTLSI